jgi:hypothetical protein
VLPLNVKPGGIGPVTAQHVQQLNERFILTGDTCDSLKQLLGLCLLDDRPIKTEYRPTHQPVQVLWTIAAARAR